MKKCSICHKWKDISCFAFQNKALNKLQEYIVYMKKYDPDVIAHILKGVADA